MLCAVIGFRNNNKLTVEEKGREFRSNYLSREKGYSIFDNFK